MSAPQNEDIKSSVRGGEPPLGKPKGYLHTAGGLVEPYSPGDEYFVVRLRSRRGRRHSGNRDANLVQQDFIGMKHFRFRFNEHVFQNDMSNDDKEDPSPYCLLLFDCWYA